MRIPRYIDLAQLESAIQAPTERRRWLAQALCVEHPDHLFFPERTNQHAYQDAKDICRACPSMYECLAAHLDEQWGCFGATTPGERKSLRVELEIRREDAAA